MRTSSPPSHAPRTAARILTGRHVLIGLLLFFGFVTVVNIVMITAAISTFGGLKTRSSYQAGIEFSAQVQRAQDQEALGWTVDVEIDGDADIRVFTVQVRDSSDSPMANLNATMTLEHPADERRDHLVALSESAAGIYTGEVSIPAGAWSLQLNLYRGETLTFRSENRVYMK
jgi:nitrogen fixation protein FixH